MRIIQEAITNAVKHSGATSVTLTTTDERQTVCIDIDDNGIGLTDETSHSGRGLRNMRYRADAIQAQIQVIALSPGTRIRLQMTDRDHPVH
ncbi:MAG: ATP-binding protein, partial [Reinekea sp.]|nr:ATP-binding protein [Reinekea sp.]